MKAWSHSSFQSALLALFRVIKYGFSRSVKRNMNRPRDANRPVGCCTPLLKVGACESIIALSYTGVDLYSSLGHHKAYKLARIDSECAFQKIEFHVVPSQ